MFVFWTMKPWKRYVNVYGLALDCELTFNRIMPI